MAKQKKNEKLVEPRINDEIIGFGNVRLVYKKYSNGTPSDEDFNKVVSLSEAKHIAERMELDLVEINGKISPPVLKVCDYSKYLFELKKNLKQKKKPSHDIKEVQLRTNISEHDLEIKAKKASEFIKDGDKVKVVLTMRGRELSRRDLSKKPIYVFVDLLSDIAVPESLPRDDGNKTIVILKKK